MTDMQAGSVRELLLRARQRWDVPVLRIGDCVGADEEVYDLAREVGGFYLIGHPPVNPRKRAFRDYDLEMEPEEYLIRNRRMVDGSGRLIAAPGEGNEVLRSGTWSTVRYARKLGVPTQLVLPNGEVLEQ